jgi:phospholipid transport system substrate-binding protein
VSTLRLRALALATLGCTMLWLASAGSASAQEAAPAAPDAAAVRAPVERLYAALLDVMKRANELGFEGRYRVLDPVMTASYDIPFMAELILGRQWKSLSPEQQKRWVETFSRLTVSTYADRFDAYSGERFEVGAVEAATQGTSMVRTSLVRTDGDPVKLDYRMRQNAGAWRIIDVYLSGTVSELALRRSEYSALMRRDGFDALLAAVGEKIAAAEAGTSEEVDAP